MPWRSLFFKEKSDRIKTFWASHTEGEIWKRLGEIIGSKDKISSWDLNRFPGGSNWLGDAQKV